MLTLNNISSPKGANRATKRIGRGQGSGQGTQAGKGHKGQKARKSGHVRSGFEGNNLPLYMRLPKRGFSNEVFKAAFAVVTLESIAKKFTNGVVSRDTLIANKLISGQDKQLPIKIIGKADLKAKLTFEGIAKFTASAQDLVKKSGSEIK